MTTFTEASTASAVAGAGSTLSHLSDDQIRAAITKVKAQQRAAAEAAARTVTFDQAAQSVNDAERQYAAAAAEVREAWPRGAEAVRESLRRRDEAMRAMSRAFGVLDVFRRRGRAADAHARSTPAEIEAEEPVHDR